MEISIIIVSYNTKKPLDDCLKSVYRHTKGVGFEILVVDNLSTDGSQEMIKRDFPKVLLIQSKKNLGFGGANNVGIKKAHGKYVFLLNPDTILLNNAVKILLDFMEQKENDKVACCGGSLYNKNMAPGVSYGNFPSLKQIIFEQYGLLKLFKSYYKNNLAVGLKNSNNEIKKVDYVSGADMMIKKSSLEKIGLFNEDFFLYYEETELSYRIFKNGFESLIVPEAKIIHLGGEPLKITDKDKIMTMKKSEFVFFEKCYGKSRKVLARFLYKFKYYLKYLFSFNKAYLDLINIINES